MEILMCIVEYLPPESAVALSLACQGFKRRLATQQVSKSLSSMEKNALLNILARDLPDTVACAPCQRLHKVQNMRRYNVIPYMGGRVPIPCCVYEDWDRYVGDITKLSKFAPYSLYMKCYERNANCKDLLALVSRKNPQPTKRGVYVQQTREECRIDRGCLIHRRQSLYVSRMAPENTTFEQLEEICQHIKLDPLIVGKSSGVRGCCQECLTEYSVDFVPVDSHGLAFLFTRWTKLSSGPDNEVWEQQLQPMHMSEKISHAIASGQALETGSDGLQLGTLPSAFGDDNTNSLLSKENMAELIKFKTICTPDNGAPGSGTS
jgi:hypothetical protein